jgi:hypothetical protein
VGKARTNIRGSSVPAKTPPDSERVIPPSPGGFGGQAEPYFDDPFPDYDTEPVYLSSVALA